MDTEDRRVRKTKKSLMDALVQLMTKKELRNITVRELTDTADIHRATFYVHYQDIYELYEQLENTVVEELSGIIFKDSAQSYESVYKKLMDYVFEHAALCRMFLGSAANRSFQRRVNTVLEEDYLNTWLLEDPNVEITEEMRYLTAYNVQGCNAIIGRWLDSDFACSKEIIIELFQKVNQYFDTVF